MLSSYKRVLYAPNVHQGGGKALLIPLLKEMENNEGTLFVLDIRIQLPVDWKPKGKVLYVQPSLISRLLLEFQLRRWVNSATEILSMNNLPPLFIPSTRISVFLQNWYLVSDVNISSFRLFTRARIMFERLWLKWSSNMVSQFIVQTQSMQSQLYKMLQKDAEILPFSACLSFCEKNKERKEEKKIDFLYVASGEPHKNHKNLICGWKDLANIGKYPSLCLTLEEESCPELYKWILLTKEEYGLHITFVNSLSRKEMTDLYKSSRALIYPSLFESFGLPLIEAIEYGLPILAAERSYVHDLIELDETFNPQSPTSIANAVDDFKFGTAKLKTNILSAKEFIDEVFNN